MANNMFNDIEPIHLTYKLPNKVELAIIETLNMCGVYGEEATIIHANVLKRINGRNSFLQCCCVEDVIKNEPDK